MAKLDIKCRIGCVSGGYDPLHTGHIRLFKDAKKFCDKLIVILNTDDFLIRKKGYVFMPFKERKEIIESIQYVDEVVECVDKDQTVCKTLEKIMPDIFANGGDVHSDNVLEKQTCRKLGIEMRFNIGGEKVQSSSELVKKVKAKPSID